MRSSFIRNASQRDKRVTYTPMFTKTFIEKSPARGKSSEDLELLKAERIKSFWELFSYETHYKEKKSIRARLQTILSSSKSLLSEVESLKESIDKDKKFIVEVKNILQCTYKKKVRKAWINHVGIAWQEFWVCVKIDRAFCICQILVNQSSFKSKVKVFSQHSSQIIVTKFDPDIQFKDILRENALVVSYFLQEYLIRINKTKEDIGNQESDCGVVQSQEVDPLYECFDNQCIVGTLVTKFGQDEVFIILFENLSVSVQLLQISYKGKTYNFISTQYRKEFDLLLSLQFSAVSSQKNTFFKSIEFTCVLQQFLKAITS